MAMRNVQRSLSRKESKALTRRRLVEAVVAIARTEGLAAVTTGRLAKTAGIQQPSFYGHFQNLDACIREATHEVSDEVRRMLRHRRASIQLSNPQQTIRDTYDAMISGFLANREIAELFLRYRRYPSAMGEVFREILDSARLDLITDMNNMGLTESLLPNFDIHAEFVIMLALAGVEGLLDGRFNDRDAVCDTLAHVTYSSLMAAMAGTSR